MRKKYIALTFLTLFLFGCERSVESTKENLNYPETISQETSIQNESASQSQTFDASPNIDETLDSLTFGITSKEIAQIIYNKEVESYSKNIASYNIDVFPNGDYLLFCVTLKEDQFPSLIYTYDQAKPGRDKSATALIKTFINNFPIESDVKQVSYNVGDSTNQMISCLYIKNSKVVNFPLTIKIVPETDYFLTIDTEEYKAACKEGRYNDILQDAQSYIDNTSPASYDNAYTLVSVLTPIVEYWDNIKVDYDSIEKVATFSYKGINKIDSNTHFFPYATTNEKQIHSLIGFYDSDWSFFESIIISSNKNIDISASYNKFEKVADNGQIYEAYDTSLEDDVLEELLSSPAHTIRFVAKDGTLKDYEMSSEEYEALVVISKFQNVRNILSDLLFCFQNRLI